jgi:hypothetical protein
MNTCTRRPPSGGVRWLPAAQFEALVERARTDPSVLAPYPLEPIATLRDRKAHAEFVAAMRAGRSRCPT